MQDGAADGGAEQGVAGSPGAQDRVGDEELLYRRVPRNNPPTFYYDRSGGRLRVLAQAFSERPIPDGETFAGQYRLSVDRAKLRGDNAELTRQGVPGCDPETFGIVSMPASEVRAIPDVDDIIPDPIHNEPGLPDNLAHALICVAFHADAKNSANKTVFRNVRQELAAAANRRPWAIDPPDDLPA